MAMWKNALIVPLAAGLSLWLAGCNPAAPPTSSTGSGTTTDSHEHGHEGHEGHDHAHHGPHSGDIMAIGDEEYHAEWTHDDASGKVTFYILDSAAKEEVPIAAERITIEVKIGENEPVIYELLAVNPSSENKSAQFEIVDSNLLGAMEAILPGKDGVTATLNVDINGKSFKQKIEKEAHDHAHGDEHKATDKPAEEKHAEEKPAEPKPE